MTPEELKERLHYDPETGVFVWKKVFTNRAKVGQEAGSINHQAGGERCKIIVGGKRYYRYALAWFYMTGAWPKRVDHINGDTLDDRFVNLREATQQQNLRNARKRSDNTSGLKGVTYHKQRGKWAAQLHCDGKHVHLGLFADKEAAGAAYVAAASRLYGEFFNSGA